MSKILIVTVLIWIFLPKCDQQQRKCHLLLPIIFFQVLDLSHNFLPTLPRGLFVGLGLPNLQKVYLASSSVEVVEDQCFRFAFQLQLPLD